MNATTELKAINVTALATIATVSAWSTGKFLVELLLVPMDDQTLLCAPAALLAITLSVICLFLIASVVGSK